MTESPKHPVGPHDIGGRTAAAVVKDEHSHALWERRVDAMMVLLTHPSRKRLVLDELRRNVEALGPGAYETIGVLRAMGRRDRRGDDRPGRGHE